MVIREAGVGAVIAVSTAGIPARKEVFEYAFSPHYPLLFTGIPIIRRCRESECIHHVSVLENMASNCIQIKPEKLYSDTEEPAILACHF